MEMTMTDYQKYLDSNIQAAPADVQAAIDQSPLDSNLFIPVERAAEMAQDGYVEVETGYAFQPDGSATVSVLTDMPNVTPDMWHWWFGWHGDSCLLYTSPSPRDLSTSRMPSSA